MELAKTETKTKFLDLNSQAASYFRVSLVNIMAMFGLQERKSVLILFTGYPLIGMIGNI